MKIFAALILKYCRMHHILCVVKNGIRFYLYTVTANNFTIIESIIYLKHECQSVCIHMPWPFLQSFSDQSF